LADLEQENPTEEPAQQQELVSTTDPDSTFATKGSRAAELGYFGLARSGLSRSRNKYGSQKIPGQSNTNRRRADQQPCLPQKFNQPISFIIVL
jgi:hypothetical protein